MFTLDLILYISVLVPLLAAVFGFIPPYGGHFHCEDTSIKFPYTGDTVSTKLLILLITLFVLVLVFCTELFHSPRPGLFSTFSFTVSSTCSIFTRYWVSLTGCAMINLALKTMLAFPRPHFLDTCQPDWSAVNCSENGGNIQFSITLCQSGQSTKAIYDAMKSFPSGHAQLACFSAAFASVYIFYRVVGTYSRLWKYWLQLVVCIAAAFISVSRLDDHRHHFADVMSGAFIGAVIGIFAAMRINFSQEKNTSSSTRKEYVKEKRPSQMRLIHPEFSYGSVVESERKSSEVNLNPAC